MQFMNLKIFALGLCLLLTAAAPAQTYIIRNLGTQNGHTSVFAQDINDKGQVAGYTKSDDLLEWSAFVIGPPYIAMTDIGSYKDFPITAIYGINNWGTAVGYSNKSSEGTKAAIWSNGVFSTFTDQFENVGGIYTDINDAGVIAGHWASSGLVLSNGDLETLPPLTDFDNATVAAVNNSGVVVGHCSTLMPDDTQATKWVGGVAMEVPDLGGDFSQAFDVADNGLIVGMSRPLSIVFFHAFMTPDGGTAVDLGTLGGDISKARATDGVIVVGSSQDSNGDDRAFIYNNNTMTDLNDLIPAASGWTLESAEAINSYGQICGYGQFMGETRSFVLTPIEPQGGAADWVFTERDNGWVAETNVPPFAPAEAAWTPGLGFGIKATGFPCFGFLQSPELTLREGRRYRLIVTIASDSLLINGTPQIRLRTLQAGSNQSEILALDSKEMVLPSSDAATFEFTFTPIATGGPPAYRFFLDFTFFDPFDDQDATVYLQRVILAEE